MNCEHERAGEIDRDDPARPHHQHGAALVIFPRHVLLSRGALGGDVVPRDLLGVVSIVLQVLHGAYLNIFEHI